ncbi:taste receptor type 2 member 41-like [Hyla sarda]|uniref:taste receptor type 2 member 41-like n=1 Tax=Hyla sarda TaxID=327740 RepID=UPI0024C26278|nr:taste receptor type 2 member 41-like [Hyla sarda]
MFSVHLIVIDIMTLLTSFLGNTFILVVNAQEWVKNKNISMSDLLICGISFFSSLYEVLKLCSYILLVPLSHLVFTYDVQRMSTVVCLAIMSCNIWISTWLSVNFCFRIVSIRHRFYIYLQRRFPKMITWLLVPSVLVSFLLSLTFSWDVSETHWSNVAFNSSSKNASSLVIAPRCVCWYEAFIVFSSLGFLLSIASLVTIIGSIYRHMKQMRRSGESFHNPNLNVHIRATKTIALLLVVNTLFCYALTLTALKGNDSQWVLYIYIFTSFCYALNSLNIILGNGKLKRKFVAGFVPCSCNGIQNNT